MISWIFWLCWIVAFGIYETYALVKKKPADTLSYKVWSIQGTGFTVARFFVGAFFLWLFFHMTFGLFTLTGK